MVVSEMSNQECLKLLAEARHARLACAADNQPYIVPMFLAYYHRPTGEDYLYGFTTFGRKVDWMRANPRVCVEVDDVSNRSEWMSVVAIGNYEELPNVHELTRGRAPSRSIPGEPHGFGRVTEQANEQLFAHRLLKARGMWWEPAATFRTSAADGQPPNRIVPVFFMIRLTQITGFRGRHEQAAATPERLPASVDQLSPGWMRRAMTFWRTRRPVLDAGGSTRGDSNVC